eukprot:22098_1
MSDPQFRHLKGGVYKLQQYDSNNAKWVDITRLLFNKGDISDYNQNLEKIGSWKGAAYGFQLKSEPHLSISGTFSLPLYTRDSIIILEKQKYRLLPEWID